ncbi:UDP-N-acetylglucosamine 2-epimerase (non-hydrolyzing) [Kitasatospora sp. MAA4]|uniref:non-hydrolyzing UDP-N-acetylglucosamine 2-epimerase n=1 Tax=Kitasatospora sp. MAA4 TaxID=3035093 RepID=UPI002474ED93|nr:UDP-N-acetylglucosamine 2-epimerase (non-hydrolyzing) [Kitasatospora sp. MAA4]MDH6136654.1 UDP-N-acetylglucosamine 2-epimerase (non-hydrolyzing) [Kitasatospora sp. MAA4]
MSRPAVAFVVGTRPEAIKLAPVAVLLGRSDWAKPNIISTGQHGATVAETLRGFGLEPDVELRPVRDLPCVGGLTSSLLHVLAAEFGHRRPELVVVQGDTSSALTGALAGFFAGIPVVHLEAGLRSRDITSPFPEEGNRKLIAQIAALHLAPTTTARDNLLAEGMDAASIVVTGNTVVDALQSSLGAAAPYNDGVLEAADRSGRPLVVVTAHRRENWGAPIGRIAAAAAMLARANPQLLVVVAAHMNPAVRATIEQPLRAVANVHLTGPMGYAPFARLLARARLIITDSGGVQEEAAALGVPVLVTRDTTERTESLDAGLSQLVGTREIDIVTAAGHLLAGDQAPAGRFDGANPYGDGRAAQRSVQACRWLLGKGERPHDLALTSLHH